MEEYFSSLLVSVRKMIDSFYNCCLNAFSSDDYDLCAKPTHFLDPQYYGLESSDLYKLDTGSDIYDEESCEYHLTLMGKCERTAQEHFEILAMGAGPCLDVAVLDFYFATLKKMVPILGNTTVLHTVTPNFGHFEGEGLTVTDLDSYRPRQKNSLPASLKSRIVMAAMFGKDFSIATWSLIGIGLTAALSTAITLVATTIGWDEQVILQGSNKSKSGKGRQSTHHQDRAFQRRFHEAERAEYQSSLNSDNSILVANAFRHIKFVSAEYESSVNGIFIDCNHLAFPYHAYKSIQNVTELLLYSGVPLQGDLPSIRFTRGWSVTRPDEARDLGIIVFNAQQPNIKSLIKHLPTREDIRGMGHGKAKRLIKGIETRGDRVYDVIQHEGPFESSYSQRSISCSLFISGETYEERVWVPDQ